MEDTHTTDVDVDGLDGDAGEATDRPQSEDRTTRELLGKLRPRHWFLGLSAHEKAAMLLIGAYTVARSTAFTLTTTPRLAILLLLGLPGLALLLIGAKRRDAPSLCLVAFLFVAVLSATTSGNAVYSLKGEISSSGTVLAWSLALGLWAIGAWFGDRARVVLPWVLVVGAVINGLVGVIQIVFSIERGPLATFAGRASGLMENPVYYGSFFAGMASWAVVRASARQSYANSGLVVLLACFMGISGSRSATVALLFVAAVSVAAYRHRYALAAAVGAVLGLWISSITVSTSGEASRSAISRFESGEGISARTDIWRYGVQAFTDRPLLGWGMNRYGSGTWQHFSLGFVRDTAWDDQRQPWTDPHNLLIYLLVTVGVFGVGALGAFAFFVLRRGVDPALGAFMLGALATWMLQPATLHSLPIAALVLGAAQRSSPGSRRWSLGARSRSALATAAAVGVVASGYVVVTDLRLSRAVDSGDVARVEDAAAWFFDDPQITELVADRADVAGAVGVADPDVAVRWAEKTVELTPDDPRAHGRLALRQFRAGDLDGMGESLAAAIELQEWNPTARSLLVLHALVTEDPERAAEAAEVVCDLELDICEQAREDARELRAELDGGG